MARKVIVDYECGCYDCTREEWERMAKSIEQRQELDCELINIIVKVPENTVACKFTATMITDDGKLQDAEMKMNATEFRQARKDFLDEVDGGDDYDKVWVLTEEGRKHADKLMGVGE